VAEPIPKPLKDDRLEARDSRRDVLRDWRRKQYELAVARDRGACVFCGKAAQDVHHVYGRGKEIGDKREAYTSLMCVCRACHPGRIVGDKAGKNLEYVEEKLKEINAQIHTDV